MCIVLLFKACFDRYDSLVVFQMVAATCSKSRLAFNIYLYFSLLYYLLNTVFCYRKSGKYFLQVATQFFLALSSTIFNILIKKISISYLFHYMPKIIPTFCFLTNFIAQFTLKNSFFFLVYSTFTDILIFSITDILIKLCIFLFSANNFEIWCQKKELFQSLHSLHLCKEFNFYILTMFFISAFILFNFLF